MDDSKLRGDADDALGRAFDNSFTRRRLLKSTAGAVAAFSVPSFFAAPSALGASTADTLTWGFASIGSLDSPAKAFDPGSQAASVLALDPLLTYDKNLHLVGAVAKAWRETNPVTYVYTLRPGAKFWDGSPVTAEDAAFSISRHLDPALQSGLASYLSAVKSITVTGPGEVTVKLKAPDPIWRYVPSYTPVIPKAFATRLGKSFGAPGGADTLMGTGPYKLVDFKADDSVTYIRNESYWGKKPIFKNVQLKIIPDSQTLQLAVRSGSLDGTFDVPPSQAKIWKRIGGVKLTTSPGLRSTFFSFDLATKPWSDIHVRRAIAYSLDRQGLVRSLLGGLGEPATSLVPRAQWSGLATPAQAARIYAGLRKYPFDLAKAKQELAKSAFPHGFSASVLYRDSRPDYGQIALSLSQNLKQIGVKLKVTQEPVSQEIAEVTGHKKLGFRVLSFGADYLDPVNYPSFMFKSTDAHPNAFNLANWKNKNIDKLLADQSKIASPGKRASVIAKIMRIAAEEIPYLPVWWEGAVMALESKYGYANFNAFYFRQNWAANISAR